ncbi:unnamed protein product [Acanthoscelides obtectus]|uniref:Uncharacterized protein n=1 Tax=Acanthoscelides obtectus TaxID=200917 RepID=A0A9P0PZM7_ACAOB|nr:unnamed protein product [Acanthoscelides obtectus]CAK1651389.1 Leucine-rich repeat-containing G-protein coupled receptor 6 [Acanthoscelides obtectus]
MKVLCFVLVVASLPVGELRETCDITACEALQQSQIELREFADYLEDQNTNSYLMKLERRLRSLEQPVWEISKANERWIDCGKGPCKCRPETKSVTCWQKDLQILPSDQTLPHDVISIDLGINKLTTLNKYAFRSMTHLAELDLFDNLLDHLPDNIFMELESLKYLRLHKNQIEEIHPDVLLYLRSLQTFDISDNLIKELPAKLFRGNSNLILLHLSRNKIRSIPETLFNGLMALEDLDLSNNDLQTIPKFALSDLKSLKRLYLTENNITLLPTDRIE